MNKHTIKLGDNKFRTAFSFTAEERTRINFGSAGINYRLPENKDEYQKTLKSFGYSPNPNIYIPEATADNITPKPEDFVNVPFRLLSATIVAGGSWRATDFSDIKVLKPSASKLNDKPVYLEHDTNPENWVGMVSNTTWTNEMTDAGGNKVPGGIDGIISIDAKTNPKIARAVLAGGIYSNSVTVVFDWKPSHEFANEFEFMDQIGKFHKDGTMIRRIVTKIYEYYESSLVFLGADPYAKLIDKDGNLVHIDHVNTYESSFSLEADQVKKMYNENKSYNISSGLTKELLSLSKTKFQLNQNSNEMDILDLLRKKLGLADDAEITQEHIDSLQVAGTPAPEQTEEEKKEIESNKSVATTAISLMKEADEKATDFNQIAKTHTLISKEELSALKGEKAVLETLKVEKENLSKEVEGLKKENSSTKLVVDKYRVEVEKHYRLQAGKNPSDVIVGIIQKANLTELEALAIQYGASALTSFGAKCGDCGSTNLSLQSSTPEGENPSDTGKKSKSMSADEIRRNAQKTNVHK